MNRNLVSGAILGKPGIKTVYDSGKLILSRSGAFMGKGYLCDGIWKLCIVNNEINKSASSSAYMIDSNSITLCHSRLAHIGISTIKRIIKYGLLSGDTNGFEKYEICIK